MRPIPYNFPAVGSDLRSCIGCLGSAYNSPAVRGLLPAAPFPFLHMKSTPSIVRAALCGAALCLAASSSLAQVNLDIQALAEKVAANELAQIDADGKVVASYADTLNYFQAQTVSVETARQQMIDGYTVKLTTLQTDLTAYQQMLTSDQQSYAAAVQALANAGGNDANLQTQVDAFAKAVLKDQDAVNYTQSQISDVTSAFQQDDAKFQSQLSSLAAKTAAVTDLYTAAQQTQAQHVATTTAFWQGGSGSLDRTSTRWNVTGSSGGPFAAALNGTHTNLYIGIAGSPGTLVLRQDFSGQITMAAPGYTLALNGHTLSGNFGGEATTIDFAGAGSSLLASANPILIGTLTILNFDVGTDVLRFGTNNMSLSAGQLALIDFVGYTNGGAAQIDSQGFVTPTGSLIPVPEPAVFAAVAGGLVLAAGLVWRRRRAHANPCAA